VSIFLLLLCHIAVDQIRRFFVMVPSGQQQCYRFQQASLAVTIWSRDEDEIRIRVQYVRPFEPAKVCKRNTREAWD